MVPQKYANRYMFSTQMIRKISLCINITMLKQYVLVKLTAS